MKPEFLVLFVLLLLQLRMRHLFVGISLSPLPLIWILTGPPKFSSSPPPLLWAPALLLSPHLLRQFLRPSRPRPKRSLSRPPLRPYPPPFLRTPSLIPRRHFLLMPLLRRKKLLPSRLLLLRKVLPALLSRVLPTCCVRELRLPKSPLPRPPAPSLLFIRALRLPW